MTVTTAAHNGLHVQLPAEQFYWARLDTAQLGDASRPNQQSLGYLFESVLPVPIEDVHATYERVDKDSFIACGIQKSTLSEICSNGALSLTPESVPTFLNVEVDTAILNLLTGPFTPPQASRLRQRLSTAVTGIVVLIAILFIFGMERRISALQQQAALYYGQQTEIGEHVFGSNSISNGLPVALRLTAELRELRSTRDVETDPLEQTQAAVALGHLLLLWPSELKTQTSSISIAPQMITIQVTLPDAASAQQLANALQPLNEWELRQPRINSTRDSVRATLQLVRRVASESETMQ